MACKYFHPSHRWPLHSADFFLFSFCQFVVVVVVVQMLFTQIQSHSSDFAFIGYAFGIIFMNSWFSLGGIYLLRDPSNFWHVIIYNNFNDYFIFVASLLMFLLSILILFLYVQAELSHFINTKFSIMFTQPFIERMERRAWRSKQWSL